MHDPDKRKLSKYFAREEEAESDLFPGNQTSMWHDCRGCDLWEAWGWRGT